ncbi:Similar to Protein HIR1; acc. no. Q1DHE1 [Pyronema omphalodes CBS 100304]|uniref:Protein HIR n=1 Tax=Pyronema omphalodes (strain CBS 100304) TaxID=1076935 RepID=U4LW01_PYROM|nr:Similar to Protein HIR1; acc. no. Q1DHE1 [Pyronema omphalodes CBS 100304]
MRFLKPGWLTHSTDKKACEVYSLHVSPDGQRLATGGLDGNVRIWSTDAIYKSHEPAGQNIPKQLCSLSHHSGAVLTVRFSGNNRYLASGSDDKIVLVYERDQTAGARPVFGSGESQTEVWRTHRRLAGHDNDVSNCGWSADSSILVSVGLDSKVIIWSGYTFERLKRIDVHQSHVKGLCFDPANKYFATASDDRTVKLIKFSSPNSNSTAHDQAGNFVVETSIDAPFSTSPLTTYFRRCSWSPDGAHIAAPNATNGPVSSVAIINRGNWDSEINLIGHEAPVEVCAFAPRMFTGTPPQGPVTVIACAGQDKALSIWNTSNPRPLVIIQDIATKAMTDLAWTPDGKKIFISSLDGTIICLAFDDGDLGHVLPVEENEMILQKFGVGRKGATLPEGPDSMKLEELSKASERKEVEGRMGALMMDGTNGSGNANGDIPMANTGAAMGPQWQVQPPVAEAAAPAPAEPAEKERPFKQKITITKDGKKRVAPLLVSTGGGGRSTLPNAQLLQAAASNSSTGNLDPKTTLDLSRPFDGLPKGGMAALVISNKRKAEEDPEGEEVPAAVNSKRISVTSAPDLKSSLETPEFLRPAIINPSLSVSQVRLAVPKVRTFVVSVLDSQGHPSSALPSAGATSSSSSAGPASTDWILEAKNSREPTRLTLSRAGKVLWLDFLPRSVLLVTGNSNFFAAACEDGTVHTYSPVGRRLMNPLILESTPCFLASSGWWLMTITAAGLCYVWNLKTKAAAHPPVSLAPILDIANLPKEGVTKAEAVTDAGINSRGQLIVSIGSGDGFVYNSDMMIWQRVTEAWWAAGSQYWDTSGSYRSQPAASVGEGQGPPLSAGIIPLLERRTTTEVLLHGRGRWLQRVVKLCLSREGFEGFETAVSIAHLENRVAAALLLGDREGFRGWVMTYVRRIATEGLKGKVEEVLREFAGRLEEEEGEEEDGEDGDGDEMVCGWSKRELLRDMVTAIGKHRDLQRITVPYARLLGIMETDEEEL